MEVSVIDTLRYADRLKAAGVESQQAEAMSRALNGELTGGVATKDELGSAVDKLEGDIERAATKFESDLGHAVDELRGEIGKVDAKVDAMDAKFEAKFGAMDEKFDSLRDRVDTQGRYVFMVLALIAALGLYNAVAPLVSAKAPATADAKPAVATAQTQGA